MTTATVPALPDLLTTTEAAELLRVSPGSLEVWRCHKRHNLPYCKIGRRVFYRRTHLLRWLDRRTVEGGDAES